MGAIEKELLLDGKCALVTGASRGIGADIAAVLAMAGARVGVHYRSHKAEAVRVSDAIEEGGGNAFTLQGDITESEQVSGMLRQFEAKCERMDILVNNAGALGEKQRLEDASDALIEDVLAVNLVGAMYTIRGALPLLRRAEQPVIINITSIAASSGGSVGSSLYAAAKGGLESLTRSLAKELSPKIRVNAVAPAAVPTEFHEGQISAERWERIESATPRQRLATGKDPAFAVLFLCSAGSDYITGQVLQVNGGRDLSY